MARENTASQAYQSLNQAASSARMPATPKRDARLKDGMHHNIMNGEGLRRNQSEGVLGGLPPRPSSAQPSPSHRAMVPSNNSSPVHQNGQQSDMFYMIHNVRRKLSANLEHYLIQGLGLPILFKRRERRTRSASRERTRHPSNSSEGPDGVEDFEFVENIELHHMDGFVIGSRKELGRGHKFEAINMSAPTWCDKCGDFIWGVYKQCLQCKREYTFYFIYTFSGVRAKFQYINGLSICRDYHYKGNMVLRPSYLYNGNSCIRQ